MIGGLLSLLSAITFAYSSALVRRGVLTGTVFQAMAISLPIGLPIFAIVMLMTGGFGVLADFSSVSIALLAFAGVIHFGAARYCNYRATKAMGTNLVAPVQQFSLVITLVLAVAWLGERMTVLRLIGIALVIAGPALMLVPERRKAKPVSLSAAADESVGGFKPNLAEGYFFAFVSTFGFGLSPILIRMAFEAKGITVGVAGGFVSYVAATVAVGLFLLVPERRRQESRIDSVTAKWFAVSGVAVCFSQMLRYMALGIAPVSVVIPIQRLSVIFRIYFGWMVNPQHEVFNGRMISATVVSLIGALALSVSTDSLFHFVSLPAWSAPVLGWHWP